MLEANAADLADERAAGLTDALRDRLTLNAERVAAMAGGVREVASLEDPVGEEIDSRTLESGLALRKLRLPLGVVAVVAGAPERDDRLAVLCIKSGNGSSSAARATPSAQRGPGGALLRRWPRRGLPAAGAQPLDARPGDIAELATSEGERRPDRPARRGLKKALKDVTAVPVMYAASGNCHVYVHGDADLGWRARSPSTPRSTAPASATRRRR